MTRHRLIAWLTLAAVLSVASALWVARLDGAERLDEFADTGPGSLDGRVYSAMLGPSGRPFDTPDTLVFAEGRFVSLECELRCDYPARPYRAERTQDGWRFESVTRCPYKDADIVWRGRIRGERMEGTARWTMRRWYWTVTRDFTFEAELQEGDALTRVAD